MLARAPARLHALALLAACAVVHVLAAEHVFLLESGELDRILYMSKLEDDAPDQIEVLLATSASDKFGGLGRLGFAPDKYPTQIGFTRSTDNGNEWDVLDPKNTPDPKNDFIEQYPLSEWNQPATRVGISVNGAYQFVRNRDKRVDFVSSPDVNGARVHMNCFVWSEQNYVQTDDLFFSDLDAYAIPINEKDESKQAGAVTTPNDFIFVLSNAGEIVSQITVFFVSDPVNSGCKSGVPSPNIAWIAEDEGAYIWALEYDIQNNWLYYVQGKKQSPAVRRVKWEYELPCATCNLNDNETPTPKFGDNQVIEAIVYEDGQDEPSDITVDFKAERYYVSAGRYIYMGSLDRFYGDISDPKPKEKYASRQVALPATQPIASITTVPNFAGFDWLIFGVVAGVLVAFLAGFGMWRFYRKDDGVSDDESSDDEEELADGPGVKTMQLFSAVDSFRGRNSMGERVDRGSRGGRSSGGRSSGGRSGGSRGHRSTGSRGGKSSSGSRGRSGSSGSRGRELPRMSDGGKSEFSHKQYGLVSPSGTYFSPDTDRSSNGRKHRKRSHGRSSGGHRSKSKSGGSRGYSSGNSRGYSSAGSRGSRGSSGGTQSSAGFYQSSNLDDVRVSAIHSP